MVTGGGTSGGAGGDHAWLRTDGGGLPGGPVAPGPGTGGHLHPGPFPGVRYLANANPKGNETTAPAVSAKGGTINWYRTTPGKRLRVDSDDKAGAAELQHRLGRVFPEAVGADRGWKGKRIPDQVKEWMKSKGLR